MSHKSALKTHGELKMVVGILASTSLVAQEGKIRLASRRRKLKPPQLDVEKLALS